MIAPKLHRARREALLRQLGSGLILVRGEAPSDVNANFFYLTGLAEPRGLLLLSAQGFRIGVGRMYPGPDYARGRIVHQLLVLPRSDALASRWGEDGLATSDKVGPQEIGVDAVLAREELDDLLVRNLPGTRTLHYVRGGAPSLSGRDDSDTRFVAKLRRRFFGLEINDATPFVHELRSVKDADEVRAIEASIAVIAEAMEQVFGLARPGLHEYELEAEINRVYRRHGGRHAFDPIVACGPHALQGHYKANTGQLEQGQLLLVDTGVSIAGYKGDVTRTLPVGGSFSPRQRLVYETVLQAQRQAIALCRPGARIGDIHARAFEVIDSAGFGKDFYHGTSHHLGLETHDAGDIHRPLVPGNVITVEPGIYIADEGLGIRIEDDVLVGPNGPRVLSDAIPRSVEAIEGRMASTSP